MIKGMFENTNYFTQLVITLVVILSMMFLSSSLALVIAIPVYNIDLAGLTSLMTDLEDTRNVAILKYIQIIVSLFGFVISALILAYLFSDNSNKYLWLEKKPALKFTIAAILLVIVVFPFINFVGELNSYLHFPDSFGGFKTYVEEQDKQNELLMETFLADTDLRGLFINILMIGMIPAIGEELIFRGVLQNIFTRMCKNYHWGIWIAAAIFSLIHVQVSGFFPRMLLGAMFGYMLIWSGSIWIPILAHFINNVGAVFMYYLVNNGQISKKSLEYGSTTDAWPFIVVSALLGTAIFWYFYRNSTKKGLPKI